MSISLVAFFYHHLLDLFYHSIILDLHNIIFKEHQIIIIRLQEPLALTPVAERLVMELSLPVLPTHVCPDRGSNPDPPHKMRLLYQFNHRCGIC